MEPKRDFGVKKYWRKKIGVKNVFGVRKFRRKKYWRKKISSQLKRWSPEYHYLSVVNNMIDVLVLCGRKNIYHWCGKIRSIICNIFLASNHKSSRQSGIFRNLARYMCLDVYVKSSNVRKIGLISYSR